MLTCNATGTEKLKPLVIGTSISPRALYRINYDSLPVIYRANSRGWMRNDLFSEWLKNLDQIFRIQNRQVLILVDNASSHFHNQPNVDKSRELDGSGSNSEESASDNNSEPEISTTLRGNRRGRGRPRLTRTNQSLSNGRGSRGSRSTGGSMGRYGSGYGRPHTIPNYSNVQLTNIKLEFLPKNTTAHLQPMDAGVIKSFKSKYKQKYIRHILTQFEKNEDIAK
jgi:hypothetical protein